MTQINLNLRFFREIKQLSILEVSEKTEIPERTILEYEKGKANPDIETLQKLSAVYEVHLLDLLYSNSKCMRKRRVCIILFLIALFSITLAILVHSSIISILYSMDFMNSQDYHELYFKLRLDIRTWGEEGIKISLQILWLSGIVILYLLLKNNYVKIIRNVLLGTFCVFLCMLFSVVPYIIYMPSAKGDYLFPILIIMLHAILLLLLYIVTAIIKNIKNRKKKTRYD